MTHLDGQALWASAETSLQTDTLCYEGGRLDEGGSIWLFIRMQWGAAVEEEFSGEILGWYHLRCLSDIDPGGVFHFSFPFLSTIPSSESILGA